MLLKADNGTPPAGGGTEEEWWKTGTCNAAHPAATLGVSLLGSSSGNSASPTTCATWNTSASIHPVTNCSPHLALLSLLFKYDGNQRFWNLPKAFHYNFSFKPHYSPNKTQHWHKICLISSFAASAMDVKVPEKPYKVKWRTSQYVNHTEQAAKTCRMHKTAFHQKIRWTPIVSSWQSLPWQTLKTGLAKTEFLNFWNIQKLLQMFEVQIYVHHFMRCSFRDGS